MTMLEMMKNAAPVVPVVVIHNADHAVPLAEALLEGGVKSIEITLRSEAALPAIKALAKANTGILIGVGTILNADHWQQAADAGAQFGVSPGLCASLLKMNSAPPIPLLPGAVTASEIQIALEAGFQQLKFFPAESSGGAAAVKSLAGPFAHVTFCPTGGITLESAESYLKLPNVACIGGSWLTPSDALANKDWKKITALASACQTLKNTRV